MKHLGKYIVAGVVTVSISFIMIMYVSEWVWPKFNGSYSLGNNIYMLDWDGDTRIIVRGTSIRGNTCYGGEYMIPTIENRCDSIGHYAEYVVEAKADERWILIKTDNKIRKNRKYYIVDKKGISDDMTIDEIINTKIESFTDSIIFSKKCCTNKIEIQW